MDLGRYEATDLGYCWLLDTQVHRHASLLQAIQYTTRAIELNHTSNYAIQQLVLQVWSSSECIVCDTNPKMGWIVTN